MSHHTYTHRDDKSHALEENLEEEHDIKARAVYQINTKGRPLILVVTDSTLTLDYLNKNPKRVINTRSPGNFENPPNL